MNKKCFIIMPISDNENYPSGHFGRVYEHIIKPACMMADFTPVRADDVMTTNYIALDIIKQIIESDMAICDLSSRNPNVLYELGIRQAFNLPVTFIKDFKTERVFDIQGFRDIEYDENLRIDNVQNTIETIAQIIKNTYDNKNEINSLVSLLGIEPAKLTNKTKISAESELILYAIQNIENRMNSIETKIKTTHNNGVTPIDLPSNLGDIISVHNVHLLKVGIEVYSHKFGLGTVKNVYMNQENLRDSKIEVLFKNGVAKNLLPVYGKVYFVNSLYN